MARANEILEMVLNALPEMEDPENDAEHDLNNKLDKGYNYQNRGAANAKKEQNANGKHPAGLQAKAGKSS